MANRFDVFSDKEKGMLCMGLTALAIKETFNPLDEQGNFAKEVLSVGGKLIEEINRSLGNPGEPGFLMAIEAMKQSKQADNQ